MEAPKSKQSIIVQECPWGNGNRFGVVEKFKTNVWNGFKNMQEDIARLQNDMYEQKKETASNSKTLRMFLGATLMLQALLPFIMKLIFA